MRKVPDYWLRAANESHMEATWRCLNKLLLDAEDELSFAREAVARSQLEGACEPGPGVRSAQIARLRRLEELVIRRRNTRAGKRYQRYQISSMDRCAGCLGRWH